MENNYYMIITDPKDYSIDIKNNFSFIGFPERNRESIKKFKKGDRIVFYVTKKSSFAAIVEVVGDYYYKNSKVWDDEYDLWPHRIKCKPIYIIESRHMMVYIKEIWDNLSFIKSKEKWGVYVQGSYRNLKKEDYLIIEAEIKKRCQLCV